MDFGDILTQWSEVQKREKTAKTAPAAQVSHKKANAPSAEEKAAEALKKRKKDGQSNGTVAQALWDG